MRDPIVRNLVSGGVSLLAICLVLCGLVSGDYVVDQSHPQASDDGHGTAEKPFKTISQAAKSVKAGDTVIIKAGTYRESVRVRRAGEKGKLITFKAAEGQRVVVTAADRLTGWKKCTKEDAQGNPNYDKILKVELDWTPTALYEGTKKMVVAREPNAGWWQPTAVEGRNVFADSAHLTQKDKDAWTGWTVVALYQAGGGMTRHTDFTFDPATHRITLAKPWSSYTPPTGIDAKRDRYFMENHISTLDGPGQWVFVPAGSGARVFAWPAKLTAKGEPMIEAPRRNFVFEFQGQPFLVFDGLEVCFSTNHGFSTGNTGPHTDVTIQNCYIRHNAGYGIELRGPQRALIRRNIVHRNTVGIVMGGSVDSRVEENDIGWNSGDGLDAPVGTRNLRIARNYIHDHFLWGHPDNIQFWTDCEGIVIQDNVLWNAGQTMMSEGMRNTRVIGNLICGSHAVALICGGDGWEIRNNTVCATGLQPTGFNGKGFTVKNNIIVPLHAGPVYGIQDPETFKADHNLLWLAPDLAGTLVVLGRWKDSAGTLAAIREKMKQEAHGLVADPQFVNAPKFYITTFYQRVAECTTTKFYTWGKFGGNIAVGDHVELHFDGVARKVTEVGEDWFVVDTPLPAAPEAVLSVANWGKQRDFKWDLRLKPTSPARNAGDDGKDLGSTLDLHAFMKGDFNGDGQRDLPAFRAAE